jgi:hypothetical protein
MTDYMIMTASAHMPSTVRHQYRRIALVEVTDASRPPKMISMRARGMVRIIETWEKLNVGRNVRSAYTVALREAEAKLAELRRADNAVD